MLAEIVEGNATVTAEKLAAIKDPAEWLGAYLKIAEFTVPKLRRLEVSLEDLEDEDLLREVKRRRDEDERRESER